MEEFVEMPMPGVIDTLWAEEAVMDAPAEEVDSAADDLGDAGSDAGDAGAADGVGAEDTGAEDTGVDEVDGIDDGEPLTGAKLWNASKEALKEIDPKLRAAINKEIHKADRISKAFPDGIEKATATLKSIEQLAETPGTPAEKVIAETLAERDYYRELDQAFTEAKPEFVTEMAKASPEAFDKIAPMVFGKYAETNPDGFAGFVSRTVLQHMDSADVPLHFKVLDTFLGQLPDGPAKDRVIEACQGIYGWTQQLRALAAKKPELKAGSTPDNKDGDDLATREQQIAQREQQVTLQSWNAEALQPGVRQVYAEADRIGAKYKLTSDEKKKVLSKVGEELDIRLAGNKKYGEAMRGYLEAGNKQAFLQRLDAERKKLIPGATRRAVDDVVAERPAKKAAAGKADATRQPGGTKQAPAAAANNGEKVEWIGGPPSTLGLITDLNRTSHAMLLKKRAFIKGRDTVVAWK